MTLAPTNRRIETLAAIDVQAPRSDALFLRGSQPVVESIGLAAADAAAMLGISESHFYNLHKTGRLGPLPTRMGRTVRWSRAELVAWFNAGTPPRKKWIEERKRQFSSTK